MGNQNNVIIGSCMELISQTILHSQDISQSSRAAFLVNVLKHEIMQLDNQTYITQQTFIRCNTRCSLPYGKSIQANYVHVIRKRLDFNIPSSISYSKEVLNFQDVFKEWVSKNTKTVQNKYMQYFTIVHVKCWYDDNQNILL